MKSIQIPGVSLAKLTIFNHAGSNPFFLKFIGQMVLDTVNIVGVRSHTLQTLFGFYSTSIIGTLNTVTQITENHIANILPALLKGLSSDVIDFTASCYMIAALILTKVNLGKKILNTLLNKFTLFKHSSLQTEAIVLVNLIIERQKSETIEIPDKAFNSILENKNFPSILSNLKKENLDIIPIYTEIMSICLKKIQHKKENWMGCKKLLETMSVEILFDGRNAEDIIKCALSCYEINEKSKKTNSGLNDSVISIESDDDGDNKMDGGSSSLFLDENNSDVAKWYSEYLKRFDKMYPDAFDNVVKLVMKGNLGDISDERKQSLKAVLGKI